MLNTDRNRVWMEFHVSRQARDLYQFDESLFASSGTVVIANFHAARVFAQKMNDKRDLVNYPEQAVRAGQINAMGLIDEVLHLIFAQYREQVNPNVLQEALDWLYDRVGTQRSKRPYAGSTITFHRWRSIAAKP